MRNKVSKSLEERKNGYLYSAHHPGWVKRNKMPAEFGDNDLKRIILFYVFNTPCEQLSTSSIPLKDYGWTKTVWQNNALKDQLFDVARSVCFGQHKGKQHRDSELPFLPADRTV